MSIENILRKLDGDNGFWLSADPKVLICLWIGFVFILLMCPFVLNSQLRKCCYARLIERDFEQQFSLSPVSDVVPCYPIGDPRHVFTKEDAENETKKFIIDKLTPFTKKIESSDFNKENDSDVETGKRNESSSNLTVQTTDTAELVTSSSSDNLMKSNSTENLDTLNTSSQDKNESDRNVLQNKNPYICIEANEEKDLEGGTTIQIPCPGVSAECSDSEKHFINPECPICLTTFSVGDEVSWSSLECHHAFHQDCIVEWLTTLGKKSNRGSDKVLQLNLCKYKMMCPVCRQSFIPNALGE